MKIEHIIEAISRSIGKKIFDEWHHDGDIQYVDDDWLSIEIDGELFCIMAMQGSPKDDEKEEPTEEAFAEGELITLQAYEPEEKTEPEEAPKQRKKIDHQKIRSLHNAGWMNKQIADEMGLTPAQVSQSLSKSKKQLEAEE